MDLLLYKHEVEGEKDQEEPEEDAQEVQIQVRDNPDEADAGNEIEADGKQHEARLHVGAVPPGKHDGDADRDGLVQARGGDHTEEAGQHQHHHDSGTEAGDVLDDPRNNR